MRRPGILKFCRLGLTLWLLSNVWGLSAQVLQLPTRPPNAPGGQEFAAQIAALGFSAREQEVCAQVLAGNVPSFLRTLRPIRFCETLDGLTNTCTLYVTPDYLAVGSDDDYLLLPVSPNSAQRIADALRCTLPTRKIVDLIYGAAEVKLSPSPLAPTSAMTSVPVFSAHNALVRTQLALQTNAHPLGALVAGHKKDVVITPRLAHAPAKVAIYGWHKTNGAPIQPLYLGHAASWVDYSQCIRLVSQKLILNGKETSIGTMLSDPKLSALLSNEGPIPSPRYPTNAVVPSESIKTANRAESGFTGFQQSAFFREQIASFTLDPGVQVHINKPAPDVVHAGKKIMLVFYALPNGNTIEQTIGRTPKPGDDWHYDIQHIAAQTRFLRGVITNRSLVVAYLGNTLKSWPAWRKKNGDNGIPGLLDKVIKAAGAEAGTIVLAGHSGGGSLIFGYLNALARIPPEVERIAFLDSNYAYDRSLHHHEKLSSWLNAPPDHQLCILAYNDAVALLNGKSFVSASGGTWGKSHEMQSDLAQQFSFTSLTNRGFEKYRALNGRLQFLLKENPEKLILHTVQVERNGFIHAMLSGTPLEGIGYEYFGPRAYTNLIQPE